MHFLNQIPKKHNIIWCYHQKKSMLNNQCLQELALCDVQLWGGRDPTTKFDANLHSEVFIYMQGEQHAPCCAWFFLSAGNKLLHPRLECNWQAAWLASQAHCLLVRMSTRATLASALLTAWSCPHRVGALRPRAGRLTGTCLHATWFHELGQLYLEPRIEGRSG